VRTKEVIETLTILGILVLGLSCTRRIEPAVAQSGPLVGSWAYTGEDLSDAAQGVVRQFTIGDGIWAVPATLIFQQDGTTDNSGYHRCHFWILSGSRLKLSVGNGSTVIPCRVDGDTLTLTLSGTNDAVDGEPVCVFRRAGPQTTDLVNDE
jgi:hypothetical protein